MIDLVRKKEQLQIWTDKEAGVKSVFFREDNSWKRASPEELYSLTLGDLFAGRVHLLAEMMVKGDKVYIVTREEDEAGCRNKYPGSIVINLPQLLGFFKSKFTDERGDLFSSVMMAMSIFPEAHIIT